MAITVLHQQITKLPHNNLITITGQFSTTDATGTIPINSSMKLAIPVGIVAIGTPASDEILSVSEAAHVAKGVITIASSVITIARTGASKTSGLIFAVTLISPN